MLHSVGPFSFSAELGEGERDVIRKLDDLFLPREKRGGGTVRLTPRKERRQKEGGEEEKRKGGS